MSVELNDLYKLQRVDGDSPPSGGVWSQIIERLQNQKFNWTKEGHMSTCQKAALLGTGEHFSKIFDSPVNHSGDWH